MLPPGGEGQIKVTLKPKGRNTLINKKILVHTNDPEQPKFALTMVGSLLIDMVSEPLKVNIRDLPVGESGRSTFSLQLTENSTAEVTGVRVVDEDNFTIKKIETAPKSVATYEVTFKGRKDVGRTVTDVVVTTTGENTPELKIPVRANTALNLRYQQRQRFTYQDGKVKSRTLRISSLRGDAPKIKKVVDADGLLDTEVLEARGPMASIKMTVREDKVPADNDGGPHVLLVYTNDREEPKLEIEYRIVPQGAQTQDPSLTPATLRTGTVTPK